MPVSAGREIRSVESHPFADASTEAYAAVTFIRVTYADGSVRVQLLKANTNLSPIKAVSVNKLELNATVLAVRQAKVVREGMKRTVDARFFWTNSSTVRNWIRARASTYEVYICNRVGEIQSASEPQEWRYVPGRLNPADLATRSEVKDRPIPSSWREGPSFLLESDELWPRDLPWIAPTEGVRPARVHQLGATPPFDWESVSITSDDIPSLTELKPEFLALVKRCQEECFPEELERIKTKKTVRTTSRLLPLSPLLDNDGLIRLGGRHNNADLPYDIRHPPILPGKRHYHRLPPPTKPCRHGPPTGPDPSSLLADSRQRGRQEGQAQLRGLQETLRTAETTKDGRST